MKRLFVAAFLIVFPIAASAEAQRAVAIRTAVGASHYLHSDLDYTAPTLLVALRLGHGAFAVEPEFAIASHRETETFGAFGGTPTTQTSNSRFQSFAVNVVG